MSDFIDTDVPLTHDDALALMALHGEGEQAAPEGQDVLPGSATPPSACELHYQVRLQLLEAQAREAAQEERALRAERAALASV